MLPTEAKQLALQQRMAALAIHESDLEEQFITGSGNGGQKINKTASCVSLFHRPSGLRIKSQHSRSRELNRYQARKQLCEQIEERSLGTQSPRAKKSDKIRKQKSRRKRRTRSAPLHQDSLPKSESPETSIYPTSKSS